MRMTVALGVVLLMRGLRAAIVRLNRLLSRIPGYEADGMVDYLDIGEKFLGANGEIPRALMADLVHPTDAGYDIWARALRPYFERIADENKNGK